MGETHRVSRGFSNRKQFEWDKYKGPSPTPTLRPKSPGVEQVKRSMEALRKSRARLQRAGALGAGTFVVIVAALMLAAPVGQGYILRRPFNVIPSGVSYSTQGAGCAAGAIKVTHVPKFAAKSGLFSTAFDGTAPACKLKATALNPSYTDIDDSYNFQGPFFFAHNGSQAVTVGWGVAWNESVSIPSVGCKLSYSVPFSECFAEAFVDILFSGITYDETNGSQFFGPTFSSVAPLPATDVFMQNMSTRTCSGSSCSISSSNISSANLTDASTGSTTGNATYNYTGIDAVANDSNTYYIYFTVIVLSYIYAYTIDAKTTAPLTASVNVNLATHGNGFKLQYINVA